MMRRNLLLGLSLWAATTVAAHADIYSWTDDQGTVHFTEDPGTIPPKLRDKILRDRESGTPATETAPNPQTAAGKDRARPASTSGEITAEELSALQTREQWQEELLKRETAMVDVHSQLDEIAARAVKLPTGSAQKNKLMAEHQELLAQYNDMKAQYYQLVETARKAGFRVDLSQ